MTTSGMHRRPFEGRHLVGFCEYYYELIYSLLESFLDSFFRIEIFQSLFFCRL